MGTSHMLQTSITDQRNNMKTLHSLLGMTLNSTNLQEFIAMQQHFHSNATVPSSQLNSTQQIMAFSNDPTGFI
jgi:hypothetical protein